MLYGHFHPSFIPALFTDTHERTVYSGSRIADPIVVLIQVLKTRQNDLSRVNLVLYRENEREPLRCDSRIF